MKTLKISSIINFKSAYFRLVAVLVSLSIIGLSVVNNYGISMDEKREIAMVFWNVNKIVSGQPVPGDLKYYGTFFNALSEVGFQATHIFRDGKNKNFSRDADKPDTNSVNESRRLYERIKFKHYVTFIFSLIAYISVAGIVGIFAGIESAWLGPLILALFPRFWGHSFFNPKDIPFASMFTLGTLLGTYLVNYYINLSQENKSLKLGFNKITVYSLLYGLLVGLASAVRIGGCFLLFFVLITHLIISLDSQKTRQRILVFWKFYVLIFIAWSVTTIILFPSSWSNPAQWLIASLQYLSQHSWKLNVFFEGQFIAANSLPWNYLPKWLMITVPELFQITFFGGVVWIIVKYRKLTALQKASFILVLLQVLFLPLIAILKHSTMYDDVRQFMFMLPGIAAISATTLIWIYQSLSNIYRIFLISVLLILLSPIVLEMIALHPYEYVYFNRFAGGLAQAHKQYDTDYWGLSMREAVEWINNHVEPHGKVISAYWDASEIFGKSDIQFINYKYLDGKKLDKPFYYAAIPRWQLENKFPECEIVYQVIRQGVPLSVVKKCR